MPRSNNDEGTNPFEVRPKTGGLPTWGGMFRRGDPSQIPPNRFHSLLNVRLNEGEINNRPGLAYVAGTEEEACITGLFEVNQDPDCISLFFDDCEIYPSGATPDDTKITRFNEEETPPYRGYWPGSFGVSNEITKRLLAASFRSLILFRGRMLAIGDQNALGYVWYASYSSSGIEKRVDLSLAFDPVEATHGNIVDWCIRAEIATGQTTEQDVLYFTTNMGKILRWDGATLSVEHTFVGAANEPSRIICIEGTKLFVASGAVNACAYQATPGGAWTERAWPVGKELAYTQDLTEFQGIVLIAGPPNVDLGTTWVHGWNPASPASVATVWTWPPGGGAHVIERAVVRANVWYALVYSVGSFYVARGTSIGSLPNFEWSLIGVAGELNRGLGFFVLVGESLVFWWEGIREVDPETGSISIVYGPLVENTDFTGIPIETFVV